MSKSNGLFLGMAALMVALFFFMVAVFSLPVLAQDEMTAPGPEITSEFSNAVAVEESSTVEGILGPNESDFMKIPLNAGYQLRVFGSANNDIQNNGNNLTLSLYKEGGTLLSTQESRPDGIATGEVFYYKGMTEEDPSETETVYLEVKNTSNSGNNSNFTYTLTFERIDRSDAFANTDAGYDFATAIDLQLQDGLGEFSKNFLGYNICGTGKYCSTDEVDYYMLSMSAGESATFKFTPSPEMSLGLEIYGEDRSVLDSARTANPGAILEQEYVSEEDQNIYLELTSEDFGSYAMEIETEVGTAVVTSPTATPSETSAATDEGVTEPEPGAGGFNIWDYKWYLIGGGVAIIVIIVVVLIMNMLKKKKRGGGNKDEVARIREQMRTGGKPPTPSGPASPRPGATRTMKGDMKNVPSKPAPKSSPRSGAQPARPGGMPKPMTKGAPPSGLPTAGAAGTAAAGPKNVPTPPKPKFPEPRKSFNPSPTPAKPKATPPSPSAPKPSQPKAPQPSKPASSDPKPPQAPSPPKAKPGSTPGGPSTPSGGGTPSPAKPGEMSSKAQQDIDEIFGA